MNWWIEIRGKHLPHPRLHTLDALHEVEARLTDSQWALYAHALCSGYDYDDIGLMLYRDWIHATAEKKIKALAAVLRPVVEAAHKDKVAAE